MAPRVMLSDFVASQLGNCIFCIRTAFQVAAFSWGAVVLGYFSNSAIILYVTLGLSVCLTLLWIAHLIAYSVRTSRFTGYAQPNPRAEILSRRAAIPVFARILLSVTFASTVPAIARAQACPPGQTRCGAYGGGTFCCNGSCCNGNCCPPGTYCKAVPGGFACQKNGL